jgi:transcriptional regulator with XRE-family HTH domain
MARNAEPQVALGRAIATRREQLGLKQEQLALAVGTDQARISRIENAGDNPSYGLVERIAKALDLQLWELAKQAGELKARDYPHGQSAGPAVPGA